MIKGLLTPTLLALTLVFSGCTAINSIATPAAEGEDYGVRTPGTKVDDENIEAKILETMARNDARLSDAHIDVNSHNAIVLLYGQVPSQELKDKAGEIARDTRKVRQVHNELVIAANAPVGQRMNDSWLKTRTLTQLAANEDIDTRHIEVISENSTVYLMGIVTRQEAQRILNVVSEIGGIQRIVTAFEYLD